MALAAGVAAAGEAPPPASLTMEVGAGSMRSIFAMCFWRLLPSVVNHAVWPSWILSTSASAISARTVITSSLASMTMVGVVWKEFRVWPCLVTTATITPSMGATMRV